MNTVAYTIQASCSEIQIMAPSSEIAADTETANSRIEALPVLTSQNHAAMEIGHMTQIAAAAQIQGETTPIKSASYLRSSL